MSEKQTLSQASKALKASMTQLLDSVWRYIPLVGKKQRPTLGMLFVFYVMWVLAIFYIASLIGRVQ